MARQRCPMIDQGLRTGGAAAQTKDAFLGGAAAQTHFLGSWRETRIQEVRSQESGDSRELLSAQEQPERLPFIHHLAAQPPLCASAPLRETAFHLAFSGAAAPLRSWGLGVRPVFKRSGDREQETAESRVAPPPSGRCAAVVGQEEVWPLRGRP